MEHTLQLPHCWQRLLVHVLVGKYCVQTLRELYGVYVRFEQARCRGQVYVDMIIVSVPVLRNPDPPLHHKVAQAGQAEALLKSVAGAGMLQTRVQIGAHKVQALRL